MAQKRLVTFVKDGQLYAYVFTVDMVQECLRRVGLDAGNPLLSLTWEDAAEICESIRWIAYSTTKSIGLNG